MAVNIGPKLGVDGEAKYRQQINNVIQQAKTLDAEMKQVTASFDKNTTAEEKATAKSQVLTKQIETQKERVKLLNDMYQKGIELYGESDTKVLSWKEALVRANTTLSNLEHQLDDVHNGVDGLGDGMEESEKKAASFGDVLRANVLGQAIINGMQKLVDLSKELTKTMIENAAAIKAENSQFSQTFGDLSGDADAAIKRVSKSSGIMQTRLNTVGSQIYAFARSSGGDAAESMSLMEKALQATADSAAYYDRSLEDTAESLQSFLKGNYANDAALGVSATETTRNAAAMEAFGKKFNDLTEIQKQETLLKMVTDAQELSGAMGQAAREADGWENVTGNLSEAWRQFTGKAGAPILEQLVPVIQQITAKLVELTDSIDWDAVGSNIANFVQTIVDNGPTIVSVIAGIGAGFVLWNVAQMINGLVVSITAFKKANEGATIAQWAMNVAMNANPIGIVVALIGAVTTALIVLWNTNEDFRNALIGIFESIKSAINSANAVIDAFVQNAIAGIKNMWHSIANTVGNIKDSIVNGFTSAIDFIKSLPSQAIEWGKDFINGLIKGITSKVTALVDSVKGIGEKIRSFLHFSRPDEGPLRDYESWMPDMIDGMAAGIRKNSYKLENAVAGMASGMNVNIGSGKVGSSNTFSIVVNPSAGMDEQRLADLVMQKIQHQVQQRELVF